MRLKSYFAGTVEAAMALAREELGPDAMLVQSKKAPADARQYGHYEVVFALADAEPEPPRFGQMFAAERGTNIDQLASELAALKQRIESMSGSLAPAARPILPPPQLAPSIVIVDRLRRVDVDADLAAEIANEVGDSDPPDAALRAAIQRRLAVDPTLGVRDASRSVIALAGPPGAGKTTALAKLATTYGLARRRSVHMISTDVFRIGAAEQLRLYASILGIGFQTVETPLALAQALEEQRRKDLIFIDTPGCVNRDIPEIHEFAGYLANDPEIDVHLVLPVSNRPSDLTRMLERYSMFRPGKLMFTRLDETDCYGPILNLANRSGKPVSFLSTGEQIPEDLEPATVEKIAALISGSQATEEFN